MCDQIIIEKLDLVLNKINEIENEVREIKSMVNNHKESVKNEVISTKPCITGLHLSPALIDMSSTTPKMTPSKAKKSSSTSKPKKGGKYDVSKVVDDTLSSILSLGNNSHTRESIKQKIVDLSEVKDFNITMNTEVASYFQLETPTVTLIEFETLLNKIFE